MTQVASPSEETTTALAEVRLGLGPNLAQFTLLVIVNAFVGAMVGLERSILPAIAEQDFPARCTLGGAVVPRAPAGLGAGWWKAQCTAPRQRR